MYAVGGVKVWPALIVMAALSELVVGGDGNTLVAVRFSSLRHHTVSTSVHLYEPKSTHGLAATAAASRTRGAILKNMSTSESTRD